MRLVTTFTASDPLNPLVYSSILTSEGIDHTVEKVITSTNEKITEVWVSDEDQIEKAQSLLNTYRSNPKQIYQEAQQKTTQAPIRSPSLRPKGVFTITIIILCIILFFWSVFTRPKQEKEIKDLLPSPALSPIEESLIYDDPLYFQLKNELLALITKDPTQITSKKAQEIYSRLVKMPIWMGITEQIIKHRKFKTPLLYEGPIFEKIRKGELWRLITPVFLHLDVIHIFFNLIWFLILAPQIEERIGLLRLSLLFLLGAIIPNTAQYLVSGPFFMGLSGVICAMAAFIYARQSVAPWEGYLLQRATILVLAIFIGALFVLSFTFFWLQFFSIVNFSLPIANTAHIVGGVVGYLLGKSKFFASRI